MNEPVLLSGTAHPALAAAIGSSLGLPVTTTTHTRYPDGEVSVRIDDTVRGADVFIVQPTIATGDALVELLLLVDAARRASARQVTAVIPYYGYGRSERKERSRMPIAASLIAKLLTTAGVHRALLLDLHADAIQGFFDMPCDHLRAAPMLARAFGPVHDAVVVAPDVGSARRARAFAEHLGGVELAIIDKRRTAPGSAEVRAVVGDVAGCHCLLFDDLVDTGGSILGAAAAVRSRGALRVSVIATHALFSGSAVTLLAGAGIDRMIVTDATPMANRFSANLPFLEVVSCADLLAQAIRRIHQGESLAPLFG